MAARVAATPDAAHITRTMTAAFQDDPVWGRWAFHDPEQLATWWRLFVDGALRYSSTWITPACEAVAMWIPPDGTELAATDEARVEPLLRELLGTRSADVLHALERFEEAHPRGGPHYYLSLLATHPDHRGRGLGIGLLEQNLARIDAEHLPAYLESTNPANNARYQRVGFVPRGEFAVIDGGPLVTTMWRTPR
jgi:GNAT superfamily N-acetyltransferase